jgi:hypothetical protein
MTYFFNDVSQNLEVMSTAVHIDFPPFQGNPRPFGGNPYRLRPFRGNLHHVDGNPLCPCPFRGIR